MKALRVLVVAALLLTVWGCVRADEVPSADTPPAEPQGQSVTEPESAPASPNDGLPIRDIAEAVTDDPDRAALLDAAHAATGITEDFYVWQLYVQGTTAVGDLQGSVSGDRVLVALVRDGDGWTTAHEERFIDASEAALLEAVPAVSTELAERVEFVVPVEVDPFFSLIADQLVANGREWGVEVMAVYAPTRLPEGFAIDEATNYEYQSAVVDYTQADRRLSYVIIIASDYGEDAPDFGYTGLRFGDLPALMARSFNNAGLGDGMGQGPHLATRAAGEHYVVGEGVSPGMVAAVAESMVRVK
ncbi:MAG: hypothetical protein JXP72_06420 [Coriobacteriia bacterium]|nr:hypothetical protein [Coriobacteriia bacterium]